MTESSDQASSAALSAMKLPQLQAIASQLGLKGTSRLRKGELIETIRASQQNADSNAKTKAVTPDAGGVAEQEGRSQPQTKPRAQTQTRGKAEETARTQRSAGASRSRGDQRQERSGSEQRTNRSDSSQGGQRAQGSSQRRDGGRSERTDQRRGEQTRNDRRDRSDRQRGENDKQGGATLDVFAEFGGDGGKDQGKQSAREAKEKPAALDDIQLPQSEGEGSARRRRGRDRRDRKRRPGNRDHQNYDEIEILEDDVLIPVAGILDVLDNYAFVRTTGYLPGPSDVYVNLGMVRRFGLRRGDAITGAVRQPREGENTGRQKFNALVTPELINNTPKDDEQPRPEFDELTPIYPDEFLDLGNGNDTQRIVNAIAPVGMGQRTLVYAAPGSGRTKFLQDLAHGVTKNHPLVHLMMVLVDERPEEVTHMQRTIQGEVIASTFDRPAGDHTTVAGLAVERAKRLVELGQDVVVILDSLTALARAHHATAPPSGRTVSHGVDAGAVHAIKRIFGAARKVENGGSLTIIGTVLTDTGSDIDELVFEELRSTPNASITLSRDLAKQEHYPAIDATASGTRNLESLFELDDLAPRIVLRRLLAQKSPADALDWLRKSMKSKSAAEFLASDVKVTPVEKAAIRRSLA